MPYQAFVGWQRTWVARQVRYSLDASIHYSPGDVSGKNSNNVFADFTNGRVLQAAYGYGVVHYAQLAPVGRGFSLSTVIQAQYAGHPLPDSEQMVLGGPSQTRGYTLDDGAFDDAALMRNDLRAPEARWSSKSGLQAAVTPFGFVDLGYGRNVATGQGTRLGSVGVGAETRLGRALSANASLARVLAGGRGTPNGSWRLDANFTVAF